LVKHILGLATPFGTKKRVRLRYVWYDVGGKESEEHYAEITDFRSAVVPEVDFAATTFHDFLDRLRQVTEPKNGYLAYLRDRYIRSLSHISYADFF